VAAASAHLERLGAASRPPGSAGNAAARAYCADVLSRLGFAVTEHAFDFSAFAGRWAAPTLITDHKA